MTLHLTENTGATEAAMDKLRENYDFYISAARIIADALIRMNGATDTASVFIEMKRRGIFTGGKTHWLGAVFRHKDYKWTGQWTTSYMSESAHASRPVKVWEFS